MDKYIISLIVALLTISCSFAQGSLSNDADSEIERLITLIDRADIIEDEHCEVPCGIYGDSLRVSLIKEHARTIEKAMNQINELSSATTPNYNQLIRWVNNKEKHAEEIQDIVAQYFMHQRVKMPKSDLSSKEMRSAYEKYHNLLSSLHAIQVYAMKCKQTTDLDNVENINEAVSDFESYYFHGHKH